MHAGKLMPVDLSIGPLASDPRCIKSHRSLMRSSHSFASHERRTLPRSHRSHAMHSSATSDAPAPPRGRLP